MYTRISPQHMIRMYTVCICVCCDCSCVCVCVSGVPVLGLRAWQSIYTYVHGVHVELGLSPDPFFLPSFSFPSSPFFSSSLRLLPLSPSRLFSFSLFSFLFSMCTSLLPCLYTHLPSFLPPSCSIWEHAVDLSILSGH